VADWVAVGVFVDDGAADVVVIAVVVVVLVGTVAGGLAGGIIGVAANAAFAVGDAREDRLASGLFAVGVVVVAAAAVAAFVVAVVVVATGSGSDRLCGMLSEPSWLELRWKHGKLDDVSNIGSLEIFA